MKEVKIIFVDTIADAGSPDPGFLILTSDGVLYKGNGTDTPEQIYDSVNFQPFFLPKSIKTSTYTIVETDTVILCDGTFTVNLPTVDGHGPNAYIIKNIGSGTITVDGFSTQTIDGSTTKTLAANEGIIIKTIDNSTGWAILSDISAAAGTPNLQAVTNVGSFTTNNLRTQTSLDIKSSGDVDYLGGFYNVGNSYAELLSSNPAFTIFSTLNYELLRFDNNSRGQTIKPYPTIANTVVFTLPNVASDKYIPVTVQINGTPTSANSSGVIDLGTVATTSGITRSVNNISGTTTAGATALTDYVYFCSGTFTLTLPTCVGNTNRYTIKCISGTLTVGTTSSQTIDGSASIGIAVEDSVDIISNNTEWKIV